MREKRRKEKHRAKTIKRIKKRMAVVIDSKIKERRTKEGSRGREKEGKWKMGEGINRSRRST